MDSDVHMIREVPDRILAQPGHLAIPGLATWLNRLGLTLTVNVKPLDKQS